MPARYAYFFPQDTLHPIVSAAALESECAPHTPAASIHTALSNLCCLQPHNCNRMSWADSMAGDCVWKLSLGHMHELLKGVKSIEKRCPCLHRYLSLL